jgi:hypothetical protein
MARNPKAKKSSKPARAVVVAEPVLEEVDTGGAGIDEGMVFTTFFLLAGAVTLMYMILNTRYPVA